jgi:hypothetical protein
MIFIHKNRKSVQQIGFKQKNTKQDAVKFNRKELIKLNDQIKCLTYNMLVMKTRSEAFNKILVIKIRTGSMKIEFLFAISEEDFLQKQIL